jgi:hypothetical protein
VAAKERSHGTPNSFPMTRGSLGPFNRKSEIANQKSIPGVETPPSDPYIAEDTL